MSRIVTVGAAQLGPIARTDSRAQAIARLIALMRRAKSHGCDLVVFPECALTAFFPHWYFERQTDIDAYFEREMPNAATQPLFDCARELSIGFYLGFAELTIDDGVTRRFNTSILVEKDSRIIGKYRKIHLPGHREYEPWRPFQNLEKRYFDVGNLGFPVFRAFGGIIGMAICNDRRWPETYRVMGLQGVEMVLLGYNTPVHNPPSPEHDNLAHFHNQLVMQAGAYQNGCWVVGVAKAGTEDGVRQIGNSVIVAPSGEIAATCSTEGDELAIARCDLDLTLSYKNTTFDFARHRQPQAYGLIVERTGAIPPPL
ncbi:MAG TPA: N-carbamoyl-D-amino-acid hydrolase [Casimicrobiaceae bacterium]